MTCFRASLNVALEWYIIFSTKQWCKLSGAGHGISGKKVPRRLPRFPSLISIPELGICLFGKAHVTNMKLILNFFSQGFKFRRQVIVFSRSPWFV